MMDMFSTEVVGTGLYPFVKIHRIIHLKWVSIAIYNLQTNKPDFNKSQLIGKGEENRGALSDEC